jgi:hypothetical protein
MSLLTMTDYYPEFLRYYALAKTQQEECNLGLIPHAESSIPDDLMKHVELYDVVERKYAGFSQIVNDIFYGWTEDHPYWQRMQAGLASGPREEIAPKWNGKRTQLKTEDWFYLFLVHRLTGSAINYAKKPSGYHNSILFHLHECENIEQMVEVIKNYKLPYYTSVGYQIAAFPKPQGEYKRGGDYFLCEWVPQLARDVAKFLETGNSKKNFREIGDFMFAWNKERGFRVFKFQYAAFIADIADWFPQYVNKESPFYYGTNAIECLNYLAHRIKGVPQEAFLDMITKKIYEDTGAYPYNSEDVTCDFIRYVENYVKPGKDYQHLDYDNLWNSCGIKDHPYGRQKAMIDLKLVPTFKNITDHPSDDKVIKSVNVTAEQYKEKVKQLYFNNQIQ